ncbi:hypothetical protein WDW37_08930 [Bdellovibrionota bacterium FG-1]
MKFEKIRKYFEWFSIGAITFLIVSLSVPKRAYCLFGEEIPFLIQIITQAIQQVQELQSIIGTGRETLGVLEEMNRGVRDVLRLADTAHLTLPSQVYSDAAQIDSATRKAGLLYGGLSDHSPLYARTHYQSGVEGLFLSEDAFQYSTQLDRQGNQIKNAAVVSNQATATRLTAETLGVILHAVNHQSRLEAKQLEIQSTRHIEEAAKEDSRLESFEQTHDAIQKDMSDAQFSSLNSYGQHE